MKHMKPTPTKDWDQLFDSLPGEEITGEPMRERKTYLLRWNPAISSFKMEAYKDALSTYPDVDSNVDFPQIVIEKGATKRGIQR